MDILVTTEHPSLVTYVDSLQKKNAEALSFYPRAVFERERDRKRILLLMLGGEPAGYIYHGGGRDGLMRCHQVCIQYDARRRLYGAALVAEMEHKAAKMNCHAVQLRCGFDLDANAFWKSLDYQCCDIQDGGVRRMRKINVWKKHLSAMLFDDSVSLTPAEGKTDASLWRKFKTSGEVNQFARGEQMHANRKIVIARANGQIDE